MAHTKAGGATRQQGNRRGKRLGVKLFDGQKISSGQIIVRQKGSKFHSGQGVSLGRDYTLFASRTGIVKFSKKTGKNIISVETV